MYISKTCCPRLSMYSCTVIIYFLLFFSICSLHSHVQYSVWTRVILDLRTYLVMNKLQKPVSLISGEASVPTFFAIHFSLPHLKYLWQLTQNKILALITVCTLRRVKESDKWHFHLQVLMWAYV